MLNIKTNISQNINNRNNRLTDISIEDKIEPDEELCPLSIHYHDHPPTDRTAQTVYIQ